jgi:MtfA peptidase
LATNLYSEYALRNFQEFWAESIELFFEKPAAMKAAYPQLYNAMQSLLNQDPFNKIISVIT